MEFEHKVGALDDEDLVVGEKEEKNWKGIVISLLVIGSILGAIIVAIILCSPNGDADSNRMKLDFDHVVSDLFKVQAFNGSWLSDHEIVYVDQNGSIVIFDAETNKSSSMLVKTYDKTMHTMDGFKLSSDRQSILFVSDSRRELMGGQLSARYAIFNISSQTVEFLDELIKANSNTPLQAPHIQFADWGPKSNSIVFIESNDIYYVPDFSRASAGPYLRLTSSAASSPPNTITNGLPNNFYRQNIFTDPEHPCLWWSPDGRYLAYLSIDDSQVETTPIELYDIEASGNPRVHQERYPRAGSPIPRATVRVVDLEEGVARGERDASELSVGIEPPAELTRQLEQDQRLGHYVTHVDWLEGAPNNMHQLMVMWTNRAQNSSLLSLCSPEGRQEWRCKLLTSFSQRVPPDNGQGRRTILGAHNANGTRLIFFAFPRPDSVIGDRLHVALLRGEDRAPKYLTHGQFDADRLLAYDANSDSLYFEVTINERAERQLYKLSSVGLIAKSQTQCLSCQLEEACDYSSIHLAKGSTPRWLVLECLGSSVPSARLMRIGNEPDTRLESQYLLSKNQEIEALVTSKQMPIEKLIAIKVNHEAEAYEVHIKLYLPNEIEEEKDKKFPLLVESSDIERRQVWKRFDLDWGKYLASRKQVIYAKIDCIRAGALGASGSVSGSRRSSSMGSLFSGELGGYFGAGGSFGPESREDQLLSGSPLFNVKDQMEAIKYMVERQDLFPWIDRRRIAIWGPSSTSAYMALATTIQDDAKLIQCTIAVSPITNWRYMNAYQAEHYLGLPWLEQNSLKYEEANLLKKNYEFSMRKLLIVHGTADEQVHVQHSMQFIKSLSEHHAFGAVIHQMQLYPDVGHSFDVVKRHFYMTLDGFVDRCFYQKPITIKATEWKGKVRPKLY